MSAKCHIRVLEPHIVSFNHSDDITGVPRGDDLIIRVEIERDRYAFQCEFRQIFLLLCFCFEIGVLDVRSAEQEIEKLIAGCDAWRNRRVETLSSCEIRLLSGASSALSSRPCLSAASTASAEVVRGRRNRRGCSHFLNGQVLPGV